MDDFDKTMIDFISCLLLLKITPEDLKDCKDCIMIQVPFPRSVFDKFQEIPVPEDINWSTNEAIADLMFISFYNTILDVARRNINVVKKQIKNGLQSEIINKTISMN
jgi:hypothetical protein